LSGREGRRHFDKVASQNGLFDAGSSAIRGRKAQHELHLAGFQQLNGDARSKHPTIGCDTSLTLHRTRYQRNSEA
jgi:hypothetical protein